MLSVGKHNGAFISYRLIVCLTRSIRIYVFKKVPPFCAKFTRAYCTTAQYVHIFCPVKRYTDTSTKRWSKRKAKVFLSFSVAMLFTPDWSHNVLKCFVKREQLFVPKFGFIQGLKWKRLFVCYTWIVQIPGFTKDWFFTLWSLEI